jgi:hypothetical protein
MILTNEGGDMHNVVMPQMIGGAQATSAPSVGVSGTPNRQLSIQAIGILRRQQTFLFHVDLVQPDLGDA